MNRSARRLEQSDDRLPAPLADPGAVDEDDRRGGRGGGGDSSLPLIHGGRYRRTTADRPSIGTEGTNATAPIAQRLRHTAHVTRDQATTRALYEDIWAFRCWPRRRRPTSCSAPSASTAIRSSGSPTGAPWPSSSSPTRTTTSVRPRAHPVAVPSRRHQGRRRRPGRLERRFKEAQLEAGGDLRARTRILPVAVHRRSQRHAPRVHRRCA